jgi:hypothetical protein
MTKADLFCEWSVDQDFKRNEHFELIKKFDLNCEVFNTYLTEDCDWYGEKTNIIFSDGSQLVLNYKGEIE